MKYFDLSSSSVKMMESCLDFANEITELQPVGEKMGVRVISTTKFHAEMAGEGIECLWGVSKSWYRSKPLELKLKKASFLQLVRGCLDPKLITKEKVRSFSKRARSYICAYYALEHTKQNINHTNDNETINHDEMALLSCVLTFCAFHFNWKFCDAHVNEIKIEAKKRGRSALAASS
jgi:hypothetical protein